MQKGRCLNVAPDYSAAAEECLSRAVKLDPCLVEAWNILGDQYWKKGDLIASKNCLTGALQQVCEPQREQGFFSLWSFNYSFISIFICFRRRIRYLYATSPWCWGSCQQLIMMNMVSVCWRVWTWPGKLCSWTSVTGLHGVSRITKKLLKVWT